MPPQQRRRARDTRLGQRIRASTQARRAATRPLSQADLERIAREEGPGILQRLGEALAKPGNVVRGGIKSAVTGTEFQDTTARELLRALGVEPEAEFTLQPDDTADFLTGILAGTAVLGTDILTDPLSLLTGVGQLGKGAAAARKAQAAVRTGKQIRRGGKDVIQDIVEELPASLRPTAEGLGAQARRLTPDEIEAAGRLGRGAREAGPFRRAPEELLGDVRIGQREEFGRARELFQEAERRGTRVGRATRELPLGPRRRPRGADPDILTVREGFQVPVGAPGARDLLQFAGRRVPIPRAIEQAIGGTAARIGAPVSRGFQRIFGRTGLVKDEIRQAESFFRRKSENVKGIQSRAIEARQEELVAQRITERGGGPEDLFAQIHREFEIDIREAREGAKGLTREVEQEFADALTKMVDARTFAQFRRGARDDSLLDEYAERILTPAGREALRAKRLLDPYKEFIQQRFDAHQAVQEGSQIGRVDYLPQITTDANQWFRDHNIIPADKDFFSLKPADTVAQTIQQRSLSTLHANLAESFVDDVAGLPGRTGDVGLPRFLQRMKMSGYRGARWKRGAKEDQIRVALDNAGLDSSITLPKEGALEFESVIGSGFSKIQPQALNNFLRKIYDPISSIYRVAVTAPFPAFHIRNLLSNTILNFMGGVNNPKHYRDAAKMFATVNEDLAKRSGVLFNRKLSDELTELGVLQGGQLKRIVREAQERGEDLGEGAISTVLAWTRNNKLSKAGFEFGQYVEDYSRLAHYLSKRAQGASKLESVKSVNKFLFDYSNKALNGLERGFLNRVTFFYRWNRFAIPLVLRTLFEHPNRAAVVIKSTVQPGVERPAGVPEFLRESAGVPVGTDPETGETSFVARFGSPFESLEFLDPTGAREPGIIGGLQKSLREVAQQLLPPLRLVMESIAGEEFFLGRKISELDKVPAIQALLGEATGLPFIGEEVDRPGGGTRFRGSPELRFALRNLPTSRVTQTGSRALELLASEAGEQSGLFQEGAARSGQRSIPQELLRTIAGVTISEVDTAAEAKRQAQRVTSKQLDDLRLQGEVGRLPVFVQTEKGRESVRAQELLKQIRDINRAQVTRSPEIQRARAQERRAQAQARPRRGRLPAGR